MAIGSHQIFVNARPHFERGSFMHAPTAVIVVGLGEEGELRPVDLQQSVRQAVMAWAERTANSTPHPARNVRLAATLLGSGGTGVSPGDAARLIAQGVCEAERASPASFGKRSPAGRA